MKLRSRSPRGSRHPLSREHRDQIDEKRSATLRLVETDARVTSRVTTAPAGYLLALGGSDVVRQCGLLDPLPAAGEVRVVATPGATAGSWHFDVATRDRPGLLAAFTGVFADAAIDITQAIVATWPDGAALQAFAVRSDGPPDATMLADALAASLDAPLCAPPVVDARLVFNQHASPLYTACQVEAPDHPGLLHAIATAIAATRTDIHAASVTTCDGKARDRFDLADRTAGKLDSSRQAEIGAALLGGVQPLVGRRGARQVQRGSALGGRSFE
jgi:predicted amino acid-binding ACT domain protein